MLLSQAFLSASSSSPPPHHPSHPFRIPIANINVEVNANATAVKSQPLHSTELSNGSYSTDVA
jgi:hypothetical protein